MPWRVGPHIFQKQPENSMAVEVPETSAYDAFIASKAHSVDAHPVPHDGDLAPHLFPHQRDIVRWALRRGRAAVFADTGLGKTAIQLEWARHASAKVRVLILAPLAVAEQTVAEGARFGVAVRYLRADDGLPGIVITNYEMLPPLRPRRLRRRRAGRVEHPQGVRRQDAHGHHRRIP